MPTTLEDLTHWLLTKGLQVVLVVLFTVITTRLIRWLAGRIQAAHQGGRTRRECAVGDRQTRSGRRVGHLVGGDLRALRGGGRRHRQSAWPAAWFTGGARGCARCRAGLRRAANCPGPAQRVLPHH